MRYNPHPPTPSPTGEGEEKLYLTVTQRAVIIITVCKLIMNNKISQFWYNGELIKGEDISISIYDSGLLYGATVFTTLRVYEKNLDHFLTFWNDHLNRLINSIKKFNWIIPNLLNIRQGAEFLKENYPVLRITIFADGRELIIGRNLPDNLITNQQTGITAWLANDPLFQRGLPSDKTGNYLGAWLALQKAIKKGAKEAILQNHQNHWLETATGNLWGYREGFWYTPPISEGILAGIMRNYLLNTLKKNNHSVKIIPWNPELIANLETIFYSNCVVQIVPIKKILIKDQYQEYNINNSALDQLHYFCFKS